MNIPVDAAYATGLCYLLAPAGWQPVITTVVILLFTSRNTVQPFLAAPSVLPRYVALSLEKAIELSILEYIAWLISCSVIMYSAHSFWEKLFMVIPVLAFSGCIISRWASPRYRWLQSETNVPARDVFVTFGDNHPELLSLDHPLSKLVVNTKTELAKAHSLLRSFAAASVDIHGPLDITWAVQKYSRLIGNRQSQIIRFVSPLRFNPNSPIFPPPLGPRYAMLHNEVDVLEIPWLSTRIPSAIWIDRRLVNMWEDERRTELPPPPGYNGQCDLFLKATICHEMLRAILLDVEKTGHLPNDD
ncbi:uncharacterized protein BJ212DRAFT_565794 [Suillus subaureus]|uniref:Uncharacterized protein n=1 Tax=Suillus subaureus TaxID=48587 RepID=A0A9P7E5U2_9AGAM|nr:uncharacterized protein BJ212DRAFT_565794 [Suillus subaureus]KAG1811290.1 hypothetical protein BJ212DRAFT_565794 [Suillus subaureus]